MKNLTQFFKICIVAVCVFSVTMSHAQNRNRLSVLVQNEALKTVFTPVNLFQVSTVPNAEKFTTDGTGLTLNYTKLKDLFMAKPKAISIQIPTANGRSFTLDVVQQNIMTNDFKVSTQNQGNVNYTAGVYYRGIVKGDFNSIAAVSIFENELMILFSNAEGNYNLGKINNHSNQYFLYNDHNVISKPEINCSTSDGDKVTDLGTQKNGGANTNSVVCKTVKCYYEADFAMYNAFSSNTTTTANYVTSIFNVKSTLYANDGMNIEISEIKVWTVTDPYASFTSTSTTNNAFITQTGSTFNGDMANLLTTRNLGGGIAQGFSGLCNKQQAHCTSMIYTTYSPFPTYSWTIMVITHEMGHLMGSRHTHACVWNGNNTAIDGCAGFVEGSCTLPGIPGGGGTIMSYCHTQSVGINLNLGFGPQPGGLLLNNVNTATCLTGSGASTPTGLTTTGITSSSATLNWNAVSGATQYTIEYKLSSVSTYTLLGTSVTNSASLSGLTANTEYNWRVSADCSPFSAPATFTTSAMAGCGVPVGLGADNIGATSARIYWSAYQGANNYKTRYRQVGTTAWTTGNIATAYRNLSGLVALTQYEFQVKAKCGTTWTTWSAKKKFTTTDLLPPNNYCASNGTNTSYEYINNVMLGSINNASGNNGGYGNYTNLMTVAAVGSSVAFNVALYTSATYNEAVSIFVDFNRDGDFDDLNETVYAATGTTNSFIGSFTIPATATIGQTRVRVSMQYNSAPPTCGTFADGEVEDYILNMTATPRLFNTDTEVDNSLNLMPNPATSVLNINVEDEDTYQVKVYNVTGSLVKELNFTGNSTILNIAELNNGVYQIVLIGTENTLNKLFVKQ